MGKKTLWIFIVLYTVLIITAFIFNSLVLFAVYRRSKKPENERSNFKTRNILIGLLCTFDILLTFTMPWTATDALTKFWPFGLGTEILCKSTKSASAAVVYSSSMMIIIIAVDSYRQIVHPTNSQLSPVAILRLTPIILSLSFLMAFPIFYHARLISPDEVSDGDQKPIHDLNDPFLKYRKNPRNPPNLWIWTIKRGLYTCIVSVEGTSK